MVYKTVAPSKGDGPRITATQEDYSKSFSVDVSQLKAKIKYVETYDKTKTVVLLALDEESTGAVMKEFIANKDRLKKHIYPRAYAKMAAARVMWTFVKSKMSKASPSSSSAAKKPTYDWLSGQFGAGDRRFMISTNLKPEDVQDGTEVVISGEIKLNGIRLAQDVQKRHGGKSSFLSLWLWVDTRAVTELKASNQEVLDAVSQLSGPRPRATKKLRARVERISQIFPLLGEAMGRALLGERVARDWNSMQWTPPNDFSMLDALAEDEDDDAVARMDKELDALEENRARLERILDEEYDSDDDDDDDDDAVTVAVVKHPKHLHRSSPQYKPNDKAEDDYDGTQPEDDAATLPLVLTPPSSPRKPAGSKRKACVKPTPRKKPRQAKK